MRPSRLTTAVLLLVVLAGCGSGGNESNDSVGALVQRVEVQSPVGVVGETAIGVEAGYPRVAAIEELTPFLLLPVEESIGPVSLDRIGLQSLVLHARPELRELLRTDRMRALDVIGDWCSEALTYACDGWTASMTNRQQNANDATGERIYFEVFEPRLGGVYCAGAAWFTSQVLKLFDFDAATICFGVPKTFATHVAVVVAMPARTTLGHASNPDGDQQGSDPAVDLFLVEPTFNVVFVERDGRSRMTLAQILDAHASDRFDERVTIEFRDLNDRRYIFGNPPAGGGGSSFRMVGANQRFVITAGDFLFWLRYWEGHADLLRSVGVSTGAQGYFDLLRKGIITVDARSSRSLRHALHELAQHHGIESCLQREFDALAATPAMSAPIETAEPAEAESFEQVR